MQKNSLFKDMEIAVVTGTLPSSTGAYDTISDFPTGFTADNCYIIGFVAQHLNSKWYSNTSDVLLMTTEGIGIRARVETSNFVSRPIKVIVAKAN